MRRFSKSIPPLKRCNNRPTTSPQKTQDPPAENPYLALVQSLEKKLTPLPTISLSCSSEFLLCKFLERHLIPPFTSKDLLHFLKNKIHHHPKLSQFDFQVFKWAQTVDSFRHDHTTYEWMVRTLVSTDRFNDLCHALDLMISNPCPCSDDSIFCCPHLEPIFQCALVSYCRVGQLDNALITFKKMKQSIDGKPDVLLYNILINGFVQNRKHEKASELYMMMLNDRVKPDVFTFNILVKNHCQNSKLDLALDLFQQMHKTENCAPNVVTFNTLIKGFIRKRKFKDGVEIAYEMLGLGCKFSVPTCEILINGLCREGKIVEACDLFMDLLNKKVVPDGYDCFWIVDYLCKAGKLDRALEILDGYWNRCGTPSVIAFTTLTECLTSSRNLESAFGLMERMLQQDIVPDRVTFNCVIESLCDAGRASDANRLRLLASRKGLNPDGVTYRLLVFGFMREGKGQEGAGVIDEMLDGDFIPDIATYNRLMKGMKK